MAAKVISEISKRLAQHTRPNKDFLVKSLRQAASALSELDQNPSLEPAIKALSDLLLKRGLLQSKDKDVRLLLAICFTEVIRILAPEPPFSDSDFREIFKLIVYMFAELADTTSPYFSRRVKILETVAELKCCLLMLDIDCDDLVLEMFNTFFSVVREQHQQSLVDAILSIMALVLKEKVSQPLLDVILRNLLKEGKGAPPAYWLAVSVIQACSEKLEPFVCGFLTSCILDRDAVESEFKEFYHEIIFKIYQCAPQMLLAVVPNLTEELLTDQVDVRIKAVNLIGKLFALPELHVAQEYRRLFVEFLKRFSDKSADVRDSALQCAKDCYLANPSGTESGEILSALYGRLLDFDDKVRTRAVIVACDLARCNLKFVPPELISEVTKRLRDKKISVRKKTLQKSLEVYRDYCTKCSEGYMSICDHLEQIPCRILMLCYEKDCKEFRPQNMELVFAEDLFPVCLSVEERTRHWIYVFSLFNSLHVKALNSILFQKRRFQTELQNYLALRKKEKENASEEVEKRVKASCLKMSAFFPDPSNAEQCFHKLNQMKDNSIFNTLEQLLDEVAIINAQASRDKFLKIIGDRHPHFEFFQTVSTKCLVNIFSSEHISCILDHLSSNGYGNKHLQAATVDLLLAIISTFPSFLRGFEKQFQMLLLEEDSSINEKLIQVLAKASPHISIKLSDIYPSLERVCLEGTRSQSKFAVSAIAALISTSEQFIFSELCKVLVDSLCSGRNVPTVLQSLGCIAQHSVSTFETRDREIIAYINEKILQVEPSEDLALFGETSEPSDSCKLKIYGLKTLVKSFLPHRGTHVRRQINELLDFLLKMLQKGDIMDDILSCENDKAHIRLAAAKSVLRLSRRWDLHISPKIFHLTILMAKDSSSSVRKLFLDKTHQLLKKHVIPCKYACAFALATSDYFKDLQDDSCNYMAEFIKEYTREARIRQTSAMQGGSVTDYPAYIAVFLIHVLAHDMGFPPEDCQDEEVYAQFCSPLFFFLLALVNASIVDGDMDLVNDAASYLLSIFRAIRRAEDAVDAKRTSNLQILADIGIYTLNALNHTGISASHAHEVILLPSSLYRISNDMKSEKAKSKYLTRDDFDEKFVKRIIRSFKSHISLTASTLAKHGRKCQEDSSQSSVLKRSILNLASCMQIDLSTTKTKEDKGSCVHEKQTQKSLREEISTRGGRKRAVSPTVPGSVGLHNECSVVGGHKNGPSGHSEPIVGKEQLSSCDSVKKPSLMESQVSSQSIDLVSAASLKHNDPARKIGSITAEPSKFSRAKLKDHCCLNEIQYKSEALVGQRIKLLSPVDKCFYSGTVDGFDSENSIHQITYDSGEVELLCLAGESWEPISEGSQPEKEVILAEESNTFHLRHSDSGERSSLSTVKETVGKFGSDAAQKQKLFPNKENGNFMSRASPLPGESRNCSLHLSNSCSIDLMDSVVISDAAKKKDQKVSADTSTSEVVNINEDAIARRTRRRKV